MNPDIMHTCHQFFAEVGRMFYGERTVEILAYKDQIGVLARWLQTVTGLLGTARFCQRLMLDLTDAGWKNVGQIRPLVEVLRTVDLDINSDDFEPRIVVNYSERTKVRATLMEALNVCVRARESGWDAERLRAEFDQWYEELMQRKFVRFALEGVWPKGRKRQKRGRRR